MNNILAIFKKQIKDTFKNKTVLIQFLMFPLFTLIMNNAIKIDNMPENFFVNLFATMFIGMAPLISMSSIISEEKEKNTLRVLMMSNVKAYQYLIGVGTYVWVACMIGASIICMAGHFTGKEAVIFMSVMAVGILASMLIGAAIGTFSRNQMMTTSITVPVMMVCSFLPMLAIFNKTIAKFAKLIYSEQIRIMLESLNDFHFDTSNVIIVLINMALAVVLFTLAYKKSGLA